MSDFNSSLPVRTEAAGDVAVKIVDNTVTSQGLAIDSSGRITIKLQDGGGTSVTSQANGGQRALDVGINVGGTQIDPRSIRALTSSDVVTAAQGAPNTAANKWPVSITDGTNSVGVLATGEAKVSVTQALPTGTNSIGAVTQGGNWSTRLQDGAGTAITSQVNGAQRALDVGINVAGVQVDPRAIRALTSSDIVSAAQSGNWSVRLQDGLGNALTSSAAGSTRPADVALRDSAGNLYGATNPFPVQFTQDIAGNEINAYSTAAAVAAAATSNHVYTVTAGKTLQMTEIIASASGKMKIEVQQETGVATAVFTTKYVAFNSTSSPTIIIPFDAPLQTAAGVKIQIIRTNLDKTAQDLYTTICGQEV